MPCTYWAPRVLTIHTVYLLALLRRFQGEARETPVVLAGDFNFTPSSSQYRLLTGQTDFASLPSRDRPRGAHTEAIKSLEPLESGWKAAQGTEPEYTVCTKTTRTGFFRDTLDYIFFRGLRAAGAGPEAPKESAEDYPLMPNEKEPSDHLKIWVDFRLN